MNQTSSVLNLTQADVTPDHTIAHGFSAGPVLALHRRWTEAWHSAEGLEESKSSLDPRLTGLVERQHRANFDLWHEEDRARDPGAPDARISAVKHRIDTLNQQRNDLVERLDDLLLERAGAQNGAAALHSETPGMIVDRLSILALKVYHTAAEALRADASPEHRARNRERLAVLEQQRDDLGRCLEGLWQEVRAGRRRFKLYRQMKMYNDPTLNPVLYGAAVAEQHEPREATPEKTQESAPGPAADEATSAQGDTDAGITSRWG